MNKTTQLIEEGMFAFIQANKDMQLGHLEYEAQNAFRHLGNAYDRIRMVEDALTMGLAPYNEAYFDLQEDYEDKARYMELANEYYAHLNKIHDEETDEQAELSDLMNDMQNWLDENIPEYILIAQMNEKKEIEDDYQSSQGWN